MTRLLESKSAIIYGGGGFLGRAVGRTFAREGASVFLVGRTEASLRRIADEVTAEGGRAYVATLDALDESAVERHVQTVVDQAGGVDISFNLTTRQDVQGTRLLEMDVEDFLRPILIGTRSNFVTARAAARRMVERGSGVILMVTSGSAGATTPPEVWPMGGTGPADAATESFMRYLAAEVGPRGVRVASLWTAGTKDTSTTATTASAEDPMEAMKDQIISSASMLRKRPTLEQFAETAAFVASDRGSGITASIVNVNSGLSPH